jgi:tRNA threonylcarbamoyladenosine biosynthesis protein TsaE
MEIFLPDTDDTRQLGINLAKSIAYLPKQVLLALEGPLGVGKTTLLQGLAFELGIKENVVSPTFVTLNEYQSGKIPFYHFDLYRFGENNEDIKEQTQFLEMELDEIANIKCVIAIEWPQYLAHYLKQKDVLFLSLQYENNGRKVIFSANNNSFQGVLDKLQNIYFC